jgi:hypothetical protein
MKTPKPPIKIAIKDNNCCVKSPCPICGRIVDPDAGPQLFMADTWEPVCEECAEKHSPVIFNIWAKFQRRSSFARAFQDCRYDGDQYVHQPPEKP